MRQDEFYCLCRDDQRIEGMLSLPDPCLGLLILAYSSCRCLKPVADWVASVLVFCFGISLKKSAAFDPMRRCKSSR
jgi:hypothetical protein